MLIVDDEPYMAEPIRDGLRLGAIAADIAGDGDAAVELLGINAYDTAVLDRDIPGPSDDEVAERIVASGTRVTLWPRARRRRDVDCRQCSDPCRPDGRHPPTTGCGSSPSSIATARRTASLRPSGKRMTAAVLPLFDPTAGRSLCNVILRRCRPANKRDNSIARRAGYPSYLLLEGVRQFR